MRACVCQEDAMRRPRGPRERLGRAEMVPAVPGGGARSDWDLRLHPRVLSRSCRARGRVQRADHGVFVMRDIAKVELLFDHPRILRARLGAAQAPQQHGAGECPVRVAPHPLHEQLVRLLLVRALVVHEQDVELAAVRRAGAGPDRTPTGAPPTPAPAPAAPASAPAPGFQTAPAPAAPVASAALTLPLVSTSSAKSRIFWIALAVEESAAAAAACFMREISAQPFTSLGPRAARRPGATPHRCYFIREMREAAAPRADGESNEGLLCGLREDGGFVWGQAPVACAEQTQEGASATRGRDLETISQRYGVAPHTMVAGAVRQVCR